MQDINRIIAAIDDFLSKKHQETTTPVEINPYLEELGFLKDSASRPGKPVRDLLRKGKIPHGYQIGVNWFIPNSGKLATTVRLSELRSFQKIERPKSVGSNSELNKLYPISQVIKKVIEDKYGSSPEIQFEFKPDWLLSNPTGDLLIKLPVIETIYNELTDGLFSLIDKVGQLSNRKLQQKQSFDIWIGEPYNFAVEFDEKQHFNQFRAITLNHYHEIPVRFPIELYKELAGGIEVKPGTSGFTKLKSNDPLFPELLDGARQDNRTRQRAFRDLLKDILPLMNGCSPTLRIPYHVTNKSISNFSLQELNNINEYLDRHNLL